MDTARFLEHENCSSEQEVQYFSLWDTVKSYLHHIKLHCKYRKARRKVRERQNWLRSVIYVSIKFDENSASTASCVICNGFVVAIEPMLDDVVAYLRETRIRNRHKFDKTS